MIERLNDAAILAALIDAGADIYLTGSRAICERPPETSDWDYLVSTCDPVGLTGFTINLLTENGFKPVEGSEEEYGEGFDWSFKRDNLNLIISRSPLFTYLWKKATEEAKRLKLRTRAERVKLFREIVDSKFETPKEKPSFDRDDDTPF